MSNANYTGGFSAGAQLFAVDGDFTSCDPCGPPMFSWPMKGDSVFSNRDIVYIYPDSALPGMTPVYAIVPLNFPPNIQPWSPNQDCILLEQEFMVAQAAFQPMRLNTPYNAIWSIGWDNSFPDGQPIPGLNDFVLISEGELQDMGGGISKIKRTWATIPPTRNEIEQFIYTFPGFETNGIFPERQSVNLNVFSRLQYDYYIFDDFNVLTTPLFTDGGNRLNASTGISPPNFILKQTLFYGTAAGYATNSVIENSSQLQDSLDDPANATLPSATEYCGWVTGLIDGSGIAKELIAESSTICRYMGNIWERRTRFVIAQ